MQNDEMKRRRTEKGLSQRALAEAAHLDPCNLNRVENGARPGLDTARRIAAALGCSLADLWPGETLRGSVVVPLQHGGPAA